jgi:hypothetical protein
MTNPTARIRFTPNRLFYILFASLILIFLFFTLGSILLGHMSLTYDEPQHFRYGELIYQLKSDRFDDSKMPISVINVIPAKIAGALFGKYISNEWQLMSIGRISTIFVSLLLGLLSFHWVKTIYGKWAGLLCFGLYVFEPNLVAHSQLITTDIYAVATLTLTLYVFWRFLEKPNLRWGILTGFALGLSQITKYSSILLIPILLLLTVMRHSEWLISTLKQRSFRKIRQALLRFTKYTILILFITSLVINLGFLFNRTGIALGDYQFKSDLFQSLQQTLPILKKIPIPLPYPYLEGLDFVMFRERTGDGYGNIYLLGELRKGTGFEGYYFIASLFKVPLPILALLIFALWDWIRTFRKEEFFRQEMILLVPALVYAIYFNFFNRAQIGIRFYLVIFPILMIFSSRVFRKWSNFSKRSRIIFGVAGLYLIISVFSYFPNYLAYFNELVPNRTFAYRYLADSNIDWGQNRANLAEFLQQHPDYQFQPSAPTAGIVIVGVNELTGVVGNPQDYQWLRENFKPIGNFDYTYLIFNIAPSDLSNIK